jgi:DNA-binding transcriptional MerR regulator
MANFVELTHTGRVVEIQQQVPNTDVVDAGADGALQATSGMLWGVGAVSTQLDIARPTLRTWDRRYGLGPSLRTAGGHRRYTEIDVARVQLMNKLLDNGVAAAQAAHIARTTDEASLVNGSAPTAPQRPNLTNRRRATSNVTSLIRATLALQPDELSRGFSVQLQRRGAVEAWEQVFAPFLVEVGELWAAGELGVECEHLASGVLTAELRAFSMLHRNRRPTPARVLLACGDEEQHALPVYALEAALAEHKIPSVVLGQALPPAALARAMVTRQPAAVFIWASMAQPAMGRTVWRTSLREPCRILLGGPGWQGVATGANGALRVERTDGMGHAVTQVSAALHD